MVEKLVSVLEYVQQVIEKLNNLNDPLWEDYVVFAVPVLEDLASKIQTYMVNENKETFLANLHKVKDKLHILDLMYADLPYYNRKDMNDLHTYLYHYVLSVIGYIEDLFEESYKEDND